CPDEPNGPAFGEDPGVRICVPVSCAEDLSGEGCSEAAERCDSDADCDGRPCVAAGARFGDHPAQKYCLDPICTGEDADLYCGETNTLCGSCECLPADCSEKECGEYPSDGCGGLCKGTC